MADEPEALSTPARIARGTAFAGIILLGIAVASRSWVSVTRGHVTVSAGPLGGRYCEQRPTATVETCTDVSLAQLDAEKQAWLVYAGAGVIAINLIVIAVLATRRRRIDQRLAIGANVLGAAPAVWFVYRVGGVDSLALGGYAAFVAYAIAIAGTVMVARMDPGAP